MIIFDLQCINGHAFEGWFDDLESLEDQLARRLVNCPVCESTDAVRVPSTFGIKSSSSTYRDTPPPPKLTEEQIFKQLAEYVDKNFDNVGSQFTDEALKIHYGAAEPRNIRGTSTKDQEDMLEKEGVNFVKFPLPVVPKDDTDA
ncbi:MAG: DUF1178 family protein [Desulfatibacillum sp.]|nr:DUF1178 family protein [Desulfatibacillum sp.]